MRTTTTLTVEPVELTAVTTAELDATETPELDAMADRWSALQQLLAMNVAAAIDHEVMAR